MFIGNMSFLTILHGVVNGRTPWWCFDFSRTWLDLLFFLVVLSFSSFNFLPFVFNNPVYQIPLFIIFFFFMNFDAYLKHHFLVSLSLHFFSSITFSSHEGENEERSLCWVCMRYFSFLILGFTICILIFQFASFPIFGFPCAILGWHFDFPVCILFFTLELFNFIRLYIVILYWGFDFQKSLLDFHFLLFNNDSLIKKRYLHVTST